MTIANTDLLTITREKLNWLGQRQRVLAQNIANADTPEYRARDLKPLNYNQEDSRNFIRFVMAKTDDRHISGHSDGRYEFDTKRDRHNYETAPMKNNVVLEEQMMKLNSTSADYQLATSIYRQFHTLYATARGNPNA